VEEISQLFEVEIVVRRKAEDGPADLDPLMVASGTAAIGGLILGRLLLSKALHPDLASLTAADAEGSTDF